MVQKNSLLFLQQGFTVIELLLVIALIGIIIMFVTPSFLSYKNGQLVQQSALDLVTTIQKAKTYAQAQVKPSQCGNSNQLASYTVVVTKGLSTGTYYLQADCGLSPAPIIGNKQSLASGVNFSNSATISYDVQTGAFHFSQSSITITTSGTSKTIKADSQGNVYIQ